ncbi:hypothetical protein [Nocardia salmonicida]|uniref:hypothetical protein n=1 Tax=Nocardia salmonicida TaxID=53431 RepID=UPI0033C07B49
MTSGWLIVHSRPDSEPAPSRRDDWVTFATGLATRLLPNPRHPARPVVLGFGAATVIGTLLLMLPVAAESRTVTEHLTALVVAPSGAAGHPDLDHSDGMQAEFSSRSPQRDSRWRDDSALAISTRGCRCRWRKRQRSGTDSLAACYP